MVFFYVTHVNHTCGPSAVVGRDEQERAVLSRLCLLTVCCGNNITYWTIMILYNKI